MPQTRDDLVRQALQEMNLLESGQDVSAEDAAAVKAVIGPKLAELAALDIIFVADDDNIDDAVFLPLVKIIAAACAEGFGIAGGKSQVLEAAAMQAEQRLRVLNRPFSTRQSLRTERICGGRRFGYGW